MAFLNSFDSIDYNAPIGKSNDTRTSSYMAHRYMSSRTYNDALNAKRIPPHPFNDDPILQTQRVSETRAKFDWKFPETDDVRNPKMYCNMSYLKDYTDIRFKFEPRPIRPAVSVTNATYKGQPVVRQEKSKMPAPLSAVSSTPVKIFDPLKASNVKSLDPYLSTARHDYVAYDPVIAAAARETTTYYNWPAKYTTLKPVTREIELMCDSSASKNCPKNPASYHSLVDPVPHKGMTTEIRENYKKPNWNNLVEKAYHLRQPEFYHQEVPSPNYTESKLIGSGHKVQKFV